MKDQYKDILVSTSHVKLRVIAFVVALAVAVGAFALAAVSLGKQETGYYEVTGNADAEALLYANGVTFQYFFEGSSRDIKQQRKQVQDAYSGALSRIYKMLDPTTEYDGYQNLAYLNAHPGEETEVSAELYGILADALARTQEGNVYSLYAGPVTAMWEEIRVLEEPAAFDPLFNEDSRERIAAAAALTGDREAITLHLVDSTRHTVRLELGEGYRAFAEQYDYTGAALDFNILRDAYTLQWLSEELTGAGYTRGVLSAKSGVTVSLADDPVGAYRVYGYVGQPDPVAAAIGEVSKTPGSAYCAWTSFPLTVGSYEHYILQGEGGETLYRHPYPCVDGTFSPCVASVACRTEQADPVAAAYAAMKLYRAADAATLSEVCSALGGEGILAGYTVQGDFSGTLYVDAPHRNAVTTTYPVNVVE